MNTSHRGVEYNIMWYLLCITKTVDASIPAQVSYLYRNVFCNSYIRTRFYFTWCVFTDLYFSWRFSVVATLGLVLYYFEIKIILNAWPNNSFPWLYGIILGLFYLHIHYCSTSLSNLDPCLSLYFTIFNHTEVRSIIVKYFSMIGSSWTSLIIYMGLKYLPLICTMW